MAIRKMGSRSDDSPWSDEIVDLVWQMAEPVPTAPDGGEMFRIDACGAVIQREKYGDREEKYGWEIDHKLAVANGGTDDLGNLQPLQWQNNAAKSDGPLRCIVGAKK